MTPSSSFFLPGRWHDATLAGAHAADVAAAIEARRRWLEERLPRGPLRLWLDAESAAPLAAEHPGSRIEAHGDEGRRDEGPWVGAVIAAGRAPVTDAGFWHRLAASLVDDRRVVVAGVFAAPGWPFGADDAVHDQRYRTALAAAGYRIQRRHELSEAARRQSTSGGPGLLATTTANGTPLHFRCDELRHDGYCIEPAGAADEAEILRLFERSFHRPRSTEHWRWKYRDWPWGAGRLSVARAPDRRLVGQYCAYPVPLVDVGRPRSIEETCHQVGDTMTAPEVRAVGRGPTSLLARLADHFYARFCEGQVAFNYGFNTGNIHRFSLRFVGARLVEPVAYREMLLHGRRTTGSGRRVTPVGRGEPLDASFDRLFAAAATDYGLLLRRDRRWLEWRYRRRPDVSYRLYVARRRRRLLGWSVFALRELPSGETILAWGDALYRRSHRWSALAVLERAVADAPEAQRLVAWFPERPTWWHQLLEQAGLRRAQEPDDLRMVVVPFEDADPVPRLRQRLYYSMADGDLF